MKGASKFTAKLLQMIQIQRVVGLREEAGSAIVPALDQMKRKAGES